MDTGQYPRRKRLSGSLGQILIGRDRDILLKMNEWHCPKLRELRFRGIMIREDWKIDSKHIIFSMAVSLLFFMVIAAKFIFGDWGTAWTVGCFFLSLRSSLCGWAK